MTYKVAHAERTNQKLHDEMIQRAEDLIPVLRERSEDAIKDRRIPKETIEDFKRLDFLRFYNQKNMAATNLIHILSLRFKLGWLKVVCPLHGY